MSKKIIRKSKCIIDHFKNLKDPRVGKNKGYLLIDIIGITICAVISGADSWLAIEEFGVSKLKWLKKYFVLDNGIPSHDTFRRIFMCINPKHFEECFLKWIKQIRDVSNGEIIAIDGKTLRRSYNAKSNKAALHMISAWATENNIVLGQRKTSEKSNEITAIPHLLKSLEINKAIVTIDAMGCQKKIADTIVKKDANFVLAVKENQGGLYKKLSSFFNSSYWEQLDGIDTFAPKEENKHGRSDLRKYWTYRYNKNIFENSPLEDWKNVKSIGMVKSQRLHKGKLKTEKRYYILSFECSAKLLGKAIRNHWHIENKLHWVLDVTFREDDCRKRAGNSGVNFAIIRRIAINLVKKGQPIKNDSIKNRRFKAALDENYLAQIMGFEF